MTNCKNCGATLSGNICEYCGTRYINMMDFNEIGEVVNVDLMNASFKAYISECSVEISLDRGVGRDFSGRLVDLQPKAKRTVTLRLYEV